MGPRFDTALRLAAGPSCRKRLLRADPTLRRVARFQHTNVSGAKPVPFRKQLKEEAKQRRLAERSPRSASIKATSPPLAAWELTVGIEVHAQLNTERKLFSAALATGDETPNSRVSRFDISLPGSQPQFQAATLLPALRAALALNCRIEKRSHFDRKHYFYADQPAGYQITQYYAPLARDGHIRLRREDGIAGEDGDHVEVGIKQLQLEQDTAKRIQRPPHTSLLDYNRVGQPLIEIITLPQIHHPETAAACVRKIQQVLLAVSSVATGMELGGLRADVNVSVRPRANSTGTSSEASTRGLGTRTEIKNLNSFKAIEDAIVAERDRQIAVLEAGGAIHGETRGWSLGATETRKLRGKEGEVDYRYMPDPDLPAIVVGESLIDHVRRSLPMLPEEQVGILTSQFGLSPADARILVALDHGQRLDYFHSVVEALSLSAATPLSRLERGRLVGNWVLHELGAVLTKTGTEFSARTVPAASLASILQYLSKGEINGQIAKKLLALVFEHENKDVELIIDKQNLRTEQLSDAEYRTMALEVVDEFPAVVEKIRGGQAGKLQWLVGQMVRRKGGRLDAQRAAGALTSLLQPR